MDKNNKCSSIIYIFHLVSSPFWAHTHSFLVHTSLRAVKNISLLRSLCRTRLKHVFLSLEESQLCNPRRPLSFFITSVTDRQTLAISAVQPQVNLWLFPLIPLMGFFTMIRGHGYTHFKLEICYGSQNRQNYLTSVVGG